MVVKNIIWDWNGTIVNDAWLFVDIMNSVLQKKRLPPTTLKHYRQNFCFPIQDYWRGLGFRFTNKGFAKLNAIFISEYRKKLFLPDLHKNVFDLLKYLKNQKIKQFVLSASEQGLLNKSIDYYGLSGFFDGVYGVDNLNAVGKEPLGQFLCVRHNLNINETVLVGDTEYDQLVAASLGCLVLLVSYGHINHQRLLITGEKVFKSANKLGTFLVRFNQ